MANLSASTASDNVPLLSEVGGALQLELKSTTDVVPSGPVGQTMVEGADQPTALLEHQSEQPPPASANSHDVAKEQAQESQAKVHVAMVNVVVEDGFPYASVSGVSTKADSTSEVTKGAGIPANMVVEDGFPYASVSGVSTKADSTSEVTKGAGIPAQAVHVAMVNMVVEDGFPYASVSGVSTKADSTSEVTKGAGIPANMVVEDGFPYASVSDKLKVASSVPRHRSSSSSDLPDSASPGDASSHMAALQAGRARSVTVPEPSSPPHPTPTTAGVRLSTHQPLPAIPRQRSDLLDEVYDSIPEGSERGPDEMYESVPDNLKVSDHTSKATPSPPGSPKTVSPKKAAPTDGRMRALTNLFRRKKEPSDDHSPSSPPHHTPFPPSVPPADDCSVDAVHVKAARTNTNTEPSSSAHHQVEKTMSLPSSMRGVGLKLASDRAHLPLPELPEDSGSSSAVVVPKPRTLEPDDPGYDLVPRGEESRGKEEEEPEYDTVTRVAIHQSGEEDTQSIDLAVVVGEEPGYDSVKREGILGLQGAQARGAEQAEDDPAYDKVKKEGAVAQELEVGEEPGYAKVDRELVESILASHQNETGDQASVGEVMTLGYAKVTKDPRLLSGDPSSLSVLQHDEMGYAMVPSGGVVARKKEELPSAPPIRHDDHGYAVVPTELKAARRGASLKKEPSQPGEEAAEPKSSVSEGGGVQLHVDPPPGVQAEGGAGHVSWQVEMRSLYSMVDVELKHELRKQRQSYHEEELLPRLLLSPSPDPNPSIPPLPSSVTLEFPDLNSPPIPQHSEEAMHLLTDTPLEPSYATVSKTSAPPAPPHLPEVEAGYAEVGTQKLLIQSTTPLQDSERVKTVALGYDTVGEVVARGAVTDSAGYDVVGQHQQPQVRAAPLGKEERDDEALGYDVVGKPQVTSKVPPE